MPYNSITSRDPIARFWDHVDISPDPNGCWVWRGLTSTGGYGLVTIHYKMYRTHQLAYELMTGPIPPGALVLHSCDNPPCVNPAHLRLGTDKDNALDRVARGRQIQGTVHHNAKLTDDAVRDIRRLHAAGANISQLSRQFDINRHQIRDVIRRKWWKHVTD